MSRNAPLLDEDDEAAPSARPRAARRTDRRKQTAQRDALAVGVLTPALLLAIVVGVLILGQSFIPDAYIESTVVPTATLPAARSAQPTAIPVAQPVDAARLNAGIVDKPPPFEWPEMSGFKAQPDPGRPSEHADYVPEISDLDMRRLIAACSVSVVMHSSPAFAQGAAEELVKPYPVRQVKQKVLDLQGTAGYVPDESVYGVVFNYSSYRIQIETVATAPPFRSGQRSTVEYATLHLADHIARRLQEIASGGRRTGPEDAAVHWRDHIARSLPFG